MRSSVLVVLFAASACDYTIHVADLRPDTARSDGGTLSETPAAGDEVDLFLLGNQELGDRVAYVDLDGDGLDDVVIADRRGDESYGTPYRGGGLYVVYGRSARFGARADLASEAVHIVGPTHEALGNGVIPVRGDFDGDGRDDLAAVFGSGIATSATVHVIYGSPQRLSGEHFIEDVSSTLGGLDYFEGGSLANLGDLDGDGCDELAIGGAGSSVVVVRGSAARWGGAEPAEIATRFTAAAPGVVDSVQAAGDLDGDGARDVIAADQTGHFAVFYGPIALTGAHAFSDAAASIEVSPNSWTGIVAADLDADGFADVAVTSSNGAAAEVEIFAGSARRFVGSYLAGDAAMRLTTGPDDANAISLSTGDADGDGRLDLLVGVPGINGDDGVPARGDAYRVAGPVVGGALAHAAVHWEGHALTALDGTPVAELLGSAVALDGDFDGDGLADALISAPTSQSGAYAEKHVYLSYGRRD